MSNYLEVKGNVLYSLSDSPSTFLPVDRRETVKEYVKSFINIKLRKPLIQLTIGGTAWESNPPDLARRSQAVLKLEGRYYF